MAIRDGAWCRSPTRPASTTMARRTIADPSDVFDPTVRTISNLLVDQTLGNPAAILTALQRPASYDPRQLAVTALISAAYEPLEAAVQARVGRCRARDAAALSRRRPPAPAIRPCRQPRQPLRSRSTQRAGGPRRRTTGRSMALLEANGIELDGANVIITNTAPDEGLSAPFNSWFTLFGQFFDHGLDLVAKGGNGTVFIPLQPDDPLYVPGSHDQFHGADPRHCRRPGADGVLGTTPTTIDAPGQHHDRLRRPEPDLHVASVAPGIPARICAQRRPAIRSRPAS